MRNILFFLEQKLIPTFTVSSTMHICDATGWLFFIQTYIKNSLILLLQNGVAVLVE